MNRAFSRIIAVFEGVAEHVGLNLDAEWRIQNDQLTGTMTILDEMPTHTDGKHSMNSLLDQIRVLGDNYGLTISSVGHEVAGHKTYILQVDSDTELDDLVKSGKLDEYCQDLASYFEYELKKRRPQRKSNELPDPERSPQAHVNRNPRPTKQFKTDVAPEISERIDAFRKASGMSKRDITEAALQAYLDQQEPK